MAVLPTPGGSSGTWGTELNTWLLVGHDTDGTTLGLPTGGTTGQVLAKASNTDYDTEWADQTGGGSTSWSRTFMSGMGG